LPALGGLLRRLRDCSGSFGWRRFHRGRGAGARPGREIPGAAIVGMPKWVPKLDENGKETGNGEFEFEEAA
jgi:hypothetical protein